MKKIPVCETCFLGNELKYVEDAVKSGWISSSGEYVKKFENTFANYCGVKHGISVCNGTVALHLALTALNIKKGDEVIIPDFTMIASAFSVCYTGATPVFVDANKDSWNIDPKKIEEKITKHTKAIMAVHIFGVPCDMNALKNIATKYDLFLIEDAAESHGAEYFNEKTGNLSHVSCFSFFANKNITTGEGGMALTNDDELADKLRYYKNLCFPLNSQRTYLHEDIGFNYRMSNLHAALGLAQTEKIDSYISLRRQHGLLYRELLKDIKGIHFQSYDEKNINPSFWMNGIYLTKEYGEKRDELLKKLTKNGIDTRLFFNGMHRQNSLKKFGCKCEEKFPVSDMLADNGFYLPSSSTLKNKEIIFICGVIKELKSN